MQKIIFDIDLLSKSDRKVYEVMTDSERASYEKTWLLLEEQKQKLQQKKNASKERAAREKKALAERERAERTRRLVQRGAILEASIKLPLEFSNDDIKRIIEEAFKSEYMMDYIEKVRCSNCGGNNTKMEKEMEKEMENDVMTTGS